MRNIKYIFDEDNEKVALLSVDVVEDPANGVEFLIMSEEPSEDTSEEVLMSNMVSERKVAVGPVLIPNKPFKRSNGRSATMDSDNIAKAMENFMTKYNNGKSRIHHMYDTDDIKVVQNWIVDRKNGVHPGYGFDNLPDGTWMQMQKFSDEVWERDVKSGEVKGFSISANMVPEEVTMSNDIDSQLDEINDLYNNLFNNAE